ncbi:hypothetical protein AN640_00840 [Candidatus Epulonipiscium fishelsonii]|uniref:Uncharacterized protein n=1 Tax=Candidatus Epulonipiscium fishelsonii TaxID=77094 RepID=A0ACC8XJB6_9FIRM|nr:hypothetical protein AN640_00840 [Epulopiscium sp. SCG-D08WGA-EpuloA1]OON91669.1 MAG: hypothetical protein ATN32_02255 [Epulopiscium sp. AS2M-Bin002]
MDKFKIFVIVAFLVLILAIAGGTFFLLTIINADAPEEPTGPIIPEATEMYALDSTIMSNISDEDKAMVRVAVSLEVDMDSEEYDDFVLQFPLKQAAIKDAIIGILRTQTRDMLSRPDTMESLKVLIKDTVHGVLGMETIVYKVYLSDFLVQ